MKRRAIQVPRRFVLEEWGGTETVILETSRHLQRSEFIPEIICPAALSRKRREVVAGVPVTRCRYFYPFLGLTPQAKKDLDKKGGNLFSFSLFFTLLSRPNVAIYHAHTMKRVGGIVRTVARLRHRPYLVTLHGGSIEVPDAERASLLKPIQHTFEWGKVLGLLVGSRRVLPDADAIVCVSPGEAELLREKMPDRRIEYLPNGVDCARFERGDGQAFRKEYGIAADEQIVLCVSRIDHQKNQLGLVEAFARIARDHPRARLVLVGPITLAHYHEKVVRRAADLGLTDRTLIIPGLPGRAEAMPNAYAAADVLVLPSIHEPFGIVILEAWAAGKPVAAPSVGGVVAFAKHEENALLFDPKNSAEIAEAIGRLLEDRPLAERLAKSGREEARSRFDWSVVTRRLVELYRDLSR